MTCRGYITPLAFQIIIFHFYGNVLVFYLIIVHCKFIFYINPPQKAIFVLFILSIVIIIVDEELTNCHIS